MWKFADTIYRTALQMSSICFRCKHFIAQKVNGSIVCERLGETDPMLQCRFFEPKG